jgi:RNA polymerase sigma-70 factor (ECF subfamily)
MSDMADEPGGGLRALYQLHAASLRRFLHARTGSADMAGDLIQELWLRIDTVASGPVVDGRAYLFRIAHNLVLDQLRERRRREGRERAWADETLGQRVDAPEPVEPTTALDIAIRQEEARRLAGAIARLPFGAQRAFRLHKLEGLSHAETAERLGISRKGVEKHMATAMQHLRRLLDEREVG